MSTSHQPDLLETAMRRWFEELSDRGIFTTDASLTVRSWNSWLEAQTGIPAAQAVGTPLLELCPTLRARGLDQYYREALAGEIRVLSERFHKNLLPISRQFHSIGITEMAQSARIAPLAVDGTIVGTITVIDDVTERVVSERELRNQIAASDHARSVAEEASKLKDEFLATLSHEIRTPLNAVLGWTQILRTQRQVKSRAHALEVIERNASSQLRLVEDLLDMARVVSGKLRLDMQPVALDQVTRAAVDVVSPAAAAKKIDVQLQMEADLPPVNGDPDRLQQAVWNLLSNAVKFTAPQGHVSVGLARVGDSLELTVRDTGQGISPDFLPYVFDRFRQADGSPSRRHGGLGLGLALVRHIVELHGGSVRAESGGENRGAAFSFVVPTIPIDVPLSQRPSDTVPVSLDGVVVMLVDDNDDAREMLTVALRGYGARVRGLASARDALAALGSNRGVPDVLVSDVGMPETDGFELIRRVRSSPVRAIRETPAIAVTAYANPSDRIRALVAGYQVHVPKPVDPSAIAASIAGLLASRRDPTRA